MLENEEAGIQAQFNEAVTEMLENGWDEVVARQALLAQWTVDQRKAQGQTHGATREVLDSIRPTLKRREEEPKPDTATTATTATGNTNTGNTGGAADKNKNKPTPAKKEDCVFSVNAANFQKVVLESPVPVLVDV